MMRRIAAALGIGAAALALARVVRPRGRVDRMQPSPSAHMYLLERSEVIDAPIERVFAFFEEPANLAELTPAGLGFEILDVQDLPMQRGTTIEYRIKPLGIPQRWGTEIVEYEPGRSFVDLQTKGPYRYWRHQHLFEPDGDRTLMRDRVEYQMPFGILGRLANALVVSRQLRQIFDYRTEAITRLFAGEAGSS